MPEVHHEPYVFIAGLTHQSVLLAWGGFYFRVRGREEDARWKLVDDSDLESLHPPRYECIGARSTSYGLARVEVFGPDGALAGWAETSTGNHAWVTGLKPSTEYSYRITVKGEAWAEGERRDWVEESGRQGMRHSGRRYASRFRTFPSPESREPFAFAVIGDFGVGVRKSKPDWCQREVAAALERAVDAYDVRLVLTTGDNIYARRILGLPIKSQGDEDDDWFFTFYQPYRYLIDRIPVYPSVGNHDSAEMEENDDREQVIDNFYLRERFRGEGAAGHASIGPGLFYRFRYGALAEFVAIDTSRATILPFEPRLFRHPDHAAFLEASFPDLGGGAPTHWRIPFGHHPPYCAGPRHRDSRSMVEYMVPRFQASGTRAFFAGHEHNYQHLEADGLQYFVTGAAGKVREGAPDRHTAAVLVAWACEGHFLVVEVDEGEMRVTAIGADDRPLVAGAFPVRIPLAR